MRQLYKRSNLKTLMFLRDYSHMLILFRLKQNSEELQESSNKVGKTIIVSFWVILRVVLIDILNCVFSKGHLLPSVRTGQEKKIN